MIIMINVMKHYNRHDVLIINLIDMHFIFIIKLINLNITIHLNIYFM